MSTTKMLLPIAMSMMGMASLIGQTNVDVNLNLKHSVGGVSDFGRERHITVHAAISEPDWVDEEAKMKYLLNDLDVYLGRDNGAAGFLMGLNPPDSERPNYPDIDSMQVQSTYWKNHFENMAPFLLQYESRAKEMIMGTNPHPIYPTLSWYDRGLTNSTPKWQPKNVETSADWVTEYLDKYFAKSPGEPGKQLPKYWEVVNEPDMLMMTGQFMVTSQEKLWEYHNLVAEGVKARLGDKAPMIGGMTWGLHDFFRQDGVGRHESGYLDEFIDEPTRAIHHAMSDSKVSATKGSEWYQWDVIWKGFMDAAGDNMDFYSVHTYDWPKKAGATNGGVLRTGGHVEAMLDMIEWYDINRNGKRKPIVLSEYGAVGESASYVDNPARGDWENLKPFSSMLMQFLERPDYIVKTMPFTPIKAVWGNTDDTAAGRYPYTMMDQDAAGNWQWTEWIKWYELWADVNGTRIDTKASDLDIQVDAYVDGKTTYLILNNLENASKTLNLNFFGENNNTLQNVRIKQLFLNGDKPTLSDTTVDTAPGSVTIEPEATMILAYTYSNAVQINQTSNEFKYMGESLSGSNGSTPHRKVVSNGTLTAQVNGVNVPSKGEAMLRLGGAFFWTHISNQDPRNVITINGFPLDFNSDWRGEDPGRNIFFGVLEVPIPLEHLRTNNVIKSTLLNVNTYTQAIIQVWDMSINPGRTGGVTPPPTTDVAVTSISINPTSTSIDRGASTTLNATILPGNATNNAVTWSSNNTNIATVDANGKVTGVNQGNATITVNTTDGNKKATATVTVNGNTPPPPPPPPTGNDLIIEAESLITTGGTFNDGEVPLGMNVTAIGVNYVNAGDYAEYSINVPAGTYSITYQISTPSDNAEITFKADGTTISSDAVPNNGQWDSYGALKAQSNVTLSAGVHTIRIDASGSNQWQWNLDKIQLTKVEGTTPTPPVVTVDGGTISGGPFNFTVGDGIADNATGISLNGNSGKNSKWVITDANSNILGLPPTLAAVQANNFDVAPAGICLIWHLSYEDNLGGDTAGANLANLTGTYDLSNSINVTRNAVVVTPPTTGTSLVIQAEDFSSTGGTFDGFQIYTANGVTGTNFNQTGDWAEYTVNIPQTDTYNVEYFISTPLNGPAIEVFVDGVSQIKDNVPNNGNWDSFVSLNASQSITLSAGTHTIRLLGAGTNGWEWNLDRFVLSSATLGAKDFGQLNNSINIHPNPAKDYFAIEGIGTEEVTVVVFDINGSKLISKNCNKSNPTIQITSLAEGVYFVVISTDSGSIKQTFKLLKKQ